MKKNIDKPKLRIRLPYLCSHFGHNNYGMIYKQVGNPDKRLKEWVGYYCTRCGVITQYDNKNKKGIYNLEKIDGSYDHSDYY